MAGETMRRKATPIKATPVKEAALQRTRRSAGAPAGAPAGASASAPEQHQAARVPEVFARLDARRRALGCSQAELARALGVSASSVSRLFRGEHGTRQPHPLAGPEGVQRIEIALRLLAHAKTPHAIQPTGAHTPRRAPGTRGPGTQRPAAATALAPAYPARPAATHADAGNTPAQPPLLTLAAHTARGRGLQGAQTVNRPVYRMLIAEDDADTVGLYRMVFNDDAEARYEMTVARSAAECIERLRGVPMDRPFDLLLMDLGIADIRGDAPEQGLLGWLERHPELRPAQLLVVSGISPYHLQYKVGELAAVNAAFLPKPFDIEELLVVVRALCDAATLPASLLRFSPVAPASPSAPAEC